MRRLLATLVLVGCGDEGAELTLEDFREAQIDARCAHAVACQLYADEETCRAVMSDRGFNWSFATLQESVVAGRVTYDAAKARACVDAFEAASCGQHEVQWPPAVCDEIFTGTIAAGETCVASDECLDGWCELAGGCDLLTMCCTGSCVADEGGAEGSPCAGAADCEPGLVCPFAGPDLDTCVVPIPLGGECHDPFTCAPGGFCLGQDGATPGICAVPPSTGETCDTADDERACDLLTDRCDPVSSTCVLRAGIGDVCVISLDCVSAAACVDGACVAYGGPGDPCDAAATFPECASGLSCTAGQCAPPPPAVACTP